MVRGEDKWGGRGIQVCETLWFVDCLLLWYDETALDFKRKAQPPQKEQTPVFYHLAIRNWQKLVGELPGNINVQ